MNATMTPVFHPVGAAHSPAAPGVESPVPPTVETTPGDPAYAIHVDASGADADVWHIEEQAA